MKLRNKVIKYLKEYPDDRFTGREIAEYIWKTYEKECLAKIKKSKAAGGKVVDEKSCITQIAGEISSSWRWWQEKSLDIKEPKQIPDINATEGRPRKYYYTDKTDEDSVAAGEQESPTPTESSNTEKQPLTEHQLYPILSEFLLSKLSVHSKRIDEKKAINNKGRDGNKWLFPDLVGMEDLSKGWQAEIRDCVGEHSDKKAQLWSFEVKRLINRSNRREAFFQTVSNSSWANLAYLVAGEISDDGTLKELRMLAGRHGIGVILLDPESPIDSEIVIPAKENIEIDWGSADRLAEQNPDFTKFIKQVTKLYKIDEINKEEWDFIPQKDDEDA